MRRDDRRVIDLNEIYDILQRCTTITLGMNGDGFPYLIPMTFGCKMEDGVITVYIHSAGAGRKWEILQSDPRVTVEAHLYDRVEQTGGGITAKYESVIGTGRAVRLTEVSDKVDAFKIMLDHYDHSGFPVTSCHGLSRSEVFEIKLDEVSGKRDL